MLPKSCYRNVCGKVFNANPYATRYRQCYRSYSLLRYTGFFQHCALGVLSTVRLAQLSLWLLLLLH